MLFPRTSVITLRRKVNRHGQGRGLTAKAAAAAVGASRATLYRWRKLQDQGRLAPCVRQPRRVRRAEWTPELVAAVHEMRVDFPMWGKAKLTVLLRRQRYTASQSTHRPCSQEAR